MELLNQYFYQWIVSNIVAILILLSAIWKPKLARFLFFIVFALAFWVNFKMANSTPEVYLDYANFTPFIVYQNFINGFFKEHIKLIVTAIALGQCMIAVGMLLKNWWVRIAGIGAIIFLLAIAPLGVGSGFPFSITASMAIYFILKRDNLNYLWKLENNKSNKD